jgi:hypothetical protein
MPGVDLAASTLVCLLVATGLAFFDLHSRIAQGGSAVTPISYLADRACWTFAAAIGVIAVALFWLTRGLDLATPSRSWSFLGDNLYARGFIVGLVSIVLIRSKVADYDGRAIGFDYAYQATRDWAANEYKIHAYRLRGQYVIRAGPKVAVIPDFDAHLIQMLTSTVKARGAKPAATLKKDLEALSPAASVYGELTYSAKLLHLTIEHIGLSATKRWCADHARQSGVEKP